MFRSTLFRAMAVAIAMLVSHPGNGGEAMTDPGITTYGTLNPAAPPQLGTFAFLVGKWSGTARARNPDGTYTDYQFDWIGRYVLDGMAIADEMRMAAAEGGTIQGMSLRYFDSASNSWTIEFFNFVRAFLRKQVNASVGAVTRDGNAITISQTGPAGRPGREIYTLVAADHFTYSLDNMKEDGQTWDEGLVTIDMKREEAP